VFENIVKNIICSQFDKTLGRDSDPQLFSSRDKAMQITFSLSADYDKEDGFRHLKILIFGGGSNYISVYGMTDWNVIENDALTDEDDPHVKDGRDYIEGATPWVLYGCHDSCWRDAVGRLLREFRERISTIDYLFNGATGWYTVVPITETAGKVLGKINSAWYDSHTKRQKLSDLEFHFGAEDDQTAKTK